MCGLSRHVSVPPAVSGADADLGKAPQGVGQVLPVPRRHIAQLLQQVVCVLAAQRAQHGGRKLHLQLPQRPQHVGQGLRVHVSQALQGLRSTCCVPAAVRGLETAWPCRHVGFLCSVSYAKLIRAWIRHLLSQAGWNRCDLLSCLASL